MSKRKRKPKSEVDPAASAAAIALVGERWRKYEEGSDERKEIGRKLAKARRKISKKRRREIAAKAAEARWAKHRAEKSAVS